MFHDAKEPDNLPLHEPWYSRLSRFHRLIVIAALRPDKLLELAHAFVSDNVGYKFVEPVRMDLGRVFSDAEARRRPILFLAGEEEGEHQGREWNRKRRYCM